ncbi:hypothetical protein Vretimale_5690 [Volvox reticuliferus]|uniref:Uncharacterized protein n=1 Tax=Volvox reticuliferus TaxID=1737510 RepID=A0A8J4LKQ7_9CHLO|nr:hypothetical protein Vretifemale_5800 [Volvox reticuliferus]GIM00775.1 hypothetical protein Vretimale_5690 [Volvox reticuliferus]
MLWNLLLGGLPAGALPYQPGRHGPGPLQATPTTTCRRRNLRIGQRNLDKLSSTPDNYKLDEPFIADTHNGFQIRDKFSDNIACVYQWNRKLQCRTQSVASAHLHASGQRCDILTAASIIGNVASSEASVRILNGLYSWRGGGAVSPGQPPRHDGADTPGGGWLMNCSRSPPIQTLDGDGGTNGSQPVANELVAQSIATDHLNSTGYDTERSCLIQPVTPDCCSADASDSSIAPHAGVLHPWRETKGCARGGARAEAGNGRGKREKHPAAQRPWSVLPSLDGQPQQAREPSSEMRTNLRQEELRRPTRRHLSLEEFLHQHDALLEAQEAVALAAAKPGTRRSTERKRKTAYAGDTLGVAVAHPMADSHALAISTRDAATKNAPRDLVCEKHRCGPVGEIALHAGDPQDMKSPDAVGAQSLPLLTDSINNGRANSTSPCRRPKHIYLYTEFELAQGAALGRMPPGSGQSAWDQTRPPSAAVAAGPRTRLRRSSSGGGQAELPPAQNLEEQLTPEEKVDFWHHVCGSDENDAVPEEAGCSGGTVSGQRRSALLSLTGTPVLICVRQPEPYGAAEVYELPDLGVGPMDDATWEAWGRLPGSKRPLQPLMVVDGAARLGFEMCEPQCRGAGGWRTYEVVVGPGYSHDPARTLHPLRLVCEGRVRFDARHVWDLVDFLADPTRAGVVAHLTSAALLRTGRNREGYHPPSFCHWLLLRRWGARGLAHVEWSPGDTLRHVNAVRRWSQPLAMEEVPR